MNRIVEEEIVNCFIVKNRRERILWELDNEKKRDSVIWHFSGISLFKPQCLKSVGQMEGDALLQYLKNIANSNIIYYIGDSYIGELPLTQAVTKINNGERCILYLGNKNGYYQGEENRGNTPRFLLKG